MGQISLKKCPGTSDRVCNILPVSHVIDKVLSIRFSVITDLSHTAVRIFLRIYILSDLDLSGREVRARANFYRPRTTLELFQSYLTSYCSMFYSIFFNYFDLILFLFSLVFQAR